MTRRIYLSGLALVSLLSACVSTPGTGPVKPPPRSTTAPSGGLVVTPPTGAVNPDGASQFISKTRLQKPASGTTLVSGTIRIDANYAEVSGAGKIISNDGAGMVMPSALIGQDAAGLIGQDAAGIIAGGAGNIIANDGASIISNDGAGLIGQDAAGLVGQDAAGLIGQDAAGYHLAQAGGSSVPPGTLLPAAGMYVRVINLLNNQAVPLGTDDKGKPVYVVVSDAKGHYELHLPEALKANVRIVASMVGSNDRRLNYNLVAAPDSSTNAQYDENTALVSAYVRLAMVSRIEPVVAVNNPDQKSITTAFSAPPEFAAIAGPIIQDMYERTQAAGISQLEPARRRRVLQRFADQLVARTPLDNLPFKDVGNYEGATTEEALPVLSELFGMLADGAATRLKAGDDLNKRSYMIEANGRRAMAGMPYYVIRKPSDLVSFVIEEYMGSSVGARSRQAQIVFDDMGISTLQYQRMVAAYSTIYIELGKKLFSDETVLDGMIAAIEEEKSPTAPKLPPAPPSEALPYPMPTPRSEDYEVSTLAGAVGGYADGPAATALLTNVTGLAFGPKRTAAGTLVDEGYLYFCDSSNHAIRRIDLTDPAHPVTTVAGRGDGGADGPALSARFGGPINLAVDTKSDPPALYFSEYETPSLHKLTLPEGQEGVLSTVLKPDGTNGVMRPWGVCLDGAGGLVFTDYDAQNVRRLDLSTQALTLVATGDEKAETTSIGLTFLSRPTDVQRAPNGDYVITDAHANAVFTVRDGKLRLAAGSNGLLSVDGFFTGAAIGMPFGSAVAGDGSLIVAERDTHLIRRVRFDAVSGAGVVNTLAGGGPMTPANGGTFLDGQGLSARFNSPQDVAVGADGTIYVGDGGNSRIRMLRPRGGN